MLKRRRRAEESSLTPRSRLLAVAITLKPLTAWTSSPSSAIGSDFSDRIVIRASWTSDGIRVSLDPDLLAVAHADHHRTGDEAARDGPSARSRA